MNDLNYRSLFSLSFEKRVSEIKALTGLAYNGYLFYILSNGRPAACLYPNMGHPYDLIFPTDHFTCPISKYNHVLRYLGLRFQCMN